MMWVCKRERGREKQGEKQRDIITSKITTSSRFIIELAEFKRKHFLNGLEIVPKYVLFPNLNTSYPVALMDELTPNALHNLLCII